jgi:hypothetical protein
MSMHATQSIARPHRQRHAACCLVSIWPFAVLPFPVASTFGVTRTVLCSLVIVLVLSSPPVHAIIDDVPEWHAVKVETVVDGQRVMVSAAVERGRFSHLSVDLGGKVVHVPVGELRDVPGPRLSTLRVSSPDVEAVRGPKLRLEFSFGSQVSGSSGADSVQFIFSELVYQGRVTERDAPKGRVRELKMPGKPPRPLETPAGPYIN